MGAFLVQEREVKTMAAKGKYADWITPEGLLKIEGWARDGLTDKQIAHNIGISHATLYEWKKQFPELSDTLKKSKDVVDRMVENALFKNAIEGNTTAQIFWLKNRKPDKWREKPAYEDTSELDKLDAILKGMKDNATNQQTE